MKHIRLFHIGGILDNISDELLCVEIGKVSVLGRVEDFVHHLSQIVEEQDIGTLDLHILVNDKQPTLEELLLVKQQDFRVNHGRDIYD